MSSKPSPWYPVAIAVVVINAAGGIYASLTNEPMHAFVHGVFAVSFGIWAWYLKQRPAYSEPQIDQQDRVELLEADRMDLETQLRETQERLEFTEQLLKNKPPPP